MDTHTRFVREVKHAQGRLIMLIGLNGIKGFKYKNRISCIERVKIVNRNSY